MWLMSMPPQDGLRKFDELIRELRAEGHAAVAANLDELLHHTGWTTGSELMGELGLVLTAFERSSPRMSLNLRRRLDACMSLVRSVWPDLK